MSEVQSLSSFQSESCDDNASIVTVIHLVNSVVDSVEKEESFSAHEPKNSRGYHWDTSDWMPSVQLPGIQEYPQYEVVEAPSTLYNDPSALDTDYYPGGYDIESDFPPPPDDFPTHEELPPLPDYGDRYDTLQPPRDTPPAGQPRLYPPAHHRRYPSDSAEPRDATGGSGGYHRGGYSAGYGRDFADPPAIDNMSLSLYTSTASCSDMSACCEESEVTMSDYDSGDEGQHFHRLDLAIPALDAQQHTEV
ncbi:hypothetical protein SKAU_G00392540 [Synaphobranchus kaupii]|uniref:Uncharacterized protein n=1 Tax=Synaphobranchus kaupii TaxID=118154 RepID=A0A9Q1IDR1_SYNKA|nr:hypothetical protein SKAU_G00392540 [Synaphobranchus kaupii]